MTEKEEMLWHKICRYDEVIDTLYKRDIRAMNERLEELRAGIGPAWPVKFYAKRYAEGRFQREETPWTCEIVEEGAQIENCIAFLRKWKPILEKLYKNGNSTTVYQFRAKSGRVIAEVK